MSIPSIRLARFGRAYEELSLGLYCSIMIELQTFSSDFPPNCTHSHPLLQAGLRNTLSESAGARIP